jgi:hypothetical protein
MATLLIKIFNLIFLGLFRHDNDIIKLSQLSRLTTTLLQTFGMKMVQEWSGRRKIEVLFIGLEGVRIFGTWQGWRARFWPCVTRLDANCQACDVIMTLVRGHRTVTPPGDVAFTYSSIILEKWLKHSHYTTSRHNGVEPTHGLHSIVPWCCVIVV